MDMYPPTITLDGGRKFAPDLSAVLPDGRTIYVECERGETPFRESKWQNIYDATGGKLYIICPNTGRRSKLVSNLNRWAGRRPVSIRATDLASMNGERFWVYEKERNRK